MDGRGWVQLAVLGLLASLLASSGCSLRRIGGDDGSEVGESGDSGSTEIASESEASSDTVDGDGDSVSDSSGDPCSDPDQARLFDFCEPFDFCELVDCEACIGGLCVAPAPVDPCAELVLIEVDDGVELSPEYLGPVLLTDLDGIPGDERIVVADGSLEVVLAGQVVVSEVHPPGVTIQVMRPLQIDTDGRTDLIISAYDSDTYERSVTFLLGDGEGGFTAEPQPFVPPDSQQTFVPVDFDQDGDHDLLSSMSLQTTITELRTNQAGMFPVAGQFEFQGRFGRAVDLDLDGFSNDAVYRADPSPLALIGEAGTMVAGPPLSAGPEVASLEYQLLAPAAADLDGDGYVEVVAALVDNQYRMGVRIWWGSADGFDDPRDQLLSVELADVEQLDFVELDGVAPAELLIQFDNPDDLRLVFARPDLANQLPLDCLGKLEAYSNADASVGDVEADGQREIAVREGDGPRLYTVAP